MDLLLEILTDDFSLDELEVLIWHLWRTDLETVARRGSQPFMAKEVVSWADRRQFRPRLAAAVRDARPTDPRVHQLADEFLETPFRGDRGELQQIIFDQVPRLDPLPWFTRALERSTKVCAIESETSGVTQRRGSGFLIAKDLVLTAYHVVDGVDSGTLRARFDYSRTRDGQDLYPGVVYAGAPGGLVTFRPSSPLDVKPKNGEVPAPKNLDFAVVRLVRPAGDHSVGADSHVTTIPKRWWIDLPAKQPSIVKESPLLIYHHPGGESMKLSIETRSILGLNANETRLHHWTNTSPGSSGSPCFDMFWNLLAMHQSAQTSTGVLHNQAVPIGLIAAVLREEHVLAETA